MRSKVDADLKAYIKAFHTRYVSVVMEAFSRRVVGWAMATHLQSELVLSALNMALYQRRPEDVIHHSDQGAQYTSIAFGMRCREAGVRPSMGSAGDCYDNAMCESFFATLECELINRRCFRTHKEARLAIFSYIEGWYNPHRRHSSIAYYAPITYELPNWRSRLPKTVRGVYGTIQPSHKYLTSSISTEHYVFLNAFQEWSRYPP